MVFLFFQCIATCVPVLTNSDQLQLMELPELEKVFETSIMFSFLGAMLFERMKIIFIEVANFTKTSDLQKGPLRLKPLTKIIIYLIKIKNKKKTNRRTSVEVHHHSMARDEFFQHDIIKIT